MSRGTRLFIYKPAGLLRVHGPDAASFLQGQFSNDLSGAAGLCVYGYWLDRKGKVLADSFVMKEASDQFLVFSYECSSEVILKRLDAYVIMDEVELDVLDEDIQACSVWGMEEGFVSELALPASGTFLAKEGLVCFRGFRGGGESYEIIQMATTGKHVVETLRTREGTQVLNTEEVDAIAILDECPLPPRAVRSSDLPQETGLKLEAISYSKGCYLGQEVMARIKSMGKIRKSLRGIRWHGADLPEDKAIQLLDSGGRKAGEIRMLTPFEGSFLGFAMIKNGVEIGDCVVDDCEVVLSLVKGNSDEAAAL